MRDLRIHDQMKFGPLEFILFLGISFFPFIGSDAFVISRCGTYLAEGYNTEIVSNFHHQQKKRVILLERNSESEIVFYISNQHIESLIPESFLGINLKLKLQFDSACFYACEGKIVEVIEPLDLFQKPKQFLMSPPTPIEGTEAPCLPNPFEKLKKG